MQSAVGFFRWLREPRPRDESGSGTAIGVAILFPALMLVIVTLQGITYASRTELALQTVADRAAHTASLCCLRVDEARRVSSVSIDANVGQFVSDRLNCTNDVAGDAAIRFRDVSGSVVPELDADGNPSLVPPGGTVTVHALCELSRQHLGPSFVLGSGVSRRAFGVATIDPYRHRFEQVGTS